jgi:hypothetical protein
MVMAAPIQAEATAVGTVAVERRSKTMWLFFMIFPPSTLFSLGAGRKAARLDTIEASEG